MSENRIVCTAEYDSSASAPSGDPQRLVITLNFEVRDIGGSPTEAERTAASGEFATFLKVTPDARFFAYKLDSAGMKLSLDTTLGEGGKLPRVGHTSADYAQRIHDWLALRAGGNWIRTDSRAEAELDYRNLTASQLLLAGHGWDAPIPQIAGLVSTVVAENAPDDPPADLVIVPYFDDDPDPNHDLLPPEAGEPPTFEYDPHGGFATIFAEARAVLEPAPDATSLVDPTTAFVRVNPRGEALHRTLKRLTDQSASMLSVFPHLVAIEWTGDPKTPSHDDLKRAVWRGMKGLATLLDPLIIGFTTGDEKREGPFVSALCAELDEEFVDLDTSMLVTAITDDLKARINAESTSSEREAVAQLMSSIGGLGPLLDSSKLNNSTSLLPVILRLYAKYNAADLPDDDGSPDTAEFLRGRARARFGNSFDAQVAIELTAIAYDLQTEAGIERASLILLEWLGVDGDYIRTILGLPETDKSACDKALAGFQQRLADSFNGADATWFAQGAAYSSRLIASARTAKGAAWGADDLGIALRSSYWFERRMGLVTPATVGAFDPLLAYLPRPADGFFVEGEGDVAANVLENAFRRICDELLPESASGIRFVPDHTPQALPLQVAIDQDVTDAGDFSDTYNGIAFLVRRDDADGTAWAHANLATLDVFKKISADEHVYERADVIIVHPLQSVAIDGQRALFLQYDGIPLSSKVFINSRASGTGRDAEYIEFYRLDDPEKESLEAKGYERLPPLAYGSTYNVAAFAIGKGGALPRGVQLGPETPWLPATVPAVPEDAADPPPFIQSFPYRRTTAIGRMTIIESAKPGFAPRIGSGIDGVTTPVPGLSAPRLQRDEGWTGRSRRLPQHGRERRVQPSRRRRNRLPVALGISGGGRGRAG